MHHLHAPLVPFSASYLVSPLLRHILIAIIYIRTRIFVTLAVNRDIIKIVAGPDFLILIHIILIPSVQIPVFIDTIIGILLFVILGILLLMIFGILLLMILGILLLVLLAFRLVLSKPGPSYCYEGHYEGIFQS